MDIRKRAEEIVKHVYGADEPPSSVEGDYNELPRWQVEKVVFERLPTVVAELYEGEEAEEILHGYGLSFNDYEQLFVETEPEGARA